MVAASADLNSMKSISTSRSCSWEDSEVAMVVAFVIAMMMTVGWWESGSGRNILAGRDGRHCLCRCRCRRHCRRLLIPRNQAVVVDRCY